MFIFKVSSIFNDPKYKPKYNFEIALDLSVKDRDIVELLERANDVRVEGIQARQRLAKMCIDKYFQKNVDALTNATAGFLSTLQRI